MTAPAAHALTYQILGQQAEALDAALADPEVAEAMRETSP